MKAVKVPLKEAEKVKKRLIKEGSLDFSHRLTKDKNFLYFPIIKSIGMKKKFPSVTIVEKRLVKGRVQKTLKQELTGKLTKRELALLKTAHDTVGSIAILEIEGSLRKKEKTIAEALLKVNSSIKTVLRKAEKHTGVFRTQKLKWLAGKRTKEALYVENNVRLRLDVEKVYFSPRLATDRKRISKMIKKDEDILVMFSGCGPYPCVFGKNSKAKSITGIEINPVGHKYAIENLKLNRLSNVRVFKGDVRKIMPGMKERYDRILMPLPKGAEGFLDLALGAAKKGAVIHFYDFLKEENIPKEAVDKIKEACKTAKKKCTVKKHVRCGQFGPGIFRVCIDFKVD